MKLSFGEKMFNISNVIFLLFVSFICLFPVLNVLAISFSESSAAAAGKVSLWPVGFTFHSYAYVFKKPEFFNSFGISVLRVIAGVTVTMAVTIITSFPLAKDAREFPQRSLYVWFLFITYVFTGGLIPVYMTVRILGLIDNFWVLILPGALNVWCIVLMLNFIRALPKELTESAVVDGAGHWTTLWRVIVPLSTPVIATLVLLTAVGHWNSFLDGLIYMSRPEHYPLQTYLQTAIVQIDLTKINEMSIEQIQALTSISDRTFRAAQIFTATLPILLVYPFLQKYFIKGIVLGSVKE